MTLWWLRWSLQTRIHQGKKWGEAGDAGKKQDLIRLVDVARCEVYVCFEGPLGAHLKQEVREKIWKGEYVEIFSLLPQEGG